MFSIGKYIKEHYWFLKMDTLKADLHNHLLIGFQPTWRKIQGHEQDNLADLMFAAATFRGIDIVAITSEEFEIPKGSVHDRFGVLSQHARRLDRGMGIYLAPIACQPQQEYTYKKFGENVFALADAFHGLVVVNGQTVIVRDGETRYDYLVIGSNQVPNRMTLADTIKYCNDRGLLHGAEHALCEEHFGIGQKNLEKHAHEIDFIETHNSQMRWSTWLSRVPKIGKYNRGVNERAKIVAQQYNKPGIATSDAHQPRDTGLSYISFSRGDLDLKGDGDNFLRNLRDAVRKGQFETHEDYAGVRDWLRWTYQFQKGISSGPIPDGKI